MERALLTEGPIGRRLLAFALPGLLTTVLQSLNASVNSMWVGHFLGEAALTATAIANTVVFLLVGASFGLAMAATILIGHHIGAGDLSGVRRVVGTSATFFAGIAILFAAAGWPLSQPLLEMLGTPTESLPLAVTYMRVILLAMPFMYMYAFVISALRGAGDARTPFRFMLMSIVLDILLNPLLIFGFGPVPGLGIAGAALATFIAQGTTLIALVRHLYRTQSVLVLRADELHMLRVDWSIISVLARKGIPMGSEILVISLSGVLMIGLVNRFDVETTAAFGAGLQVWNYIQMPAMAIGVAVSAMVAQNLGAQRWDRIGATARIGAVCSVFFTSAVVIALDLVDSHVLGLFLPPGSPALQIAEHLNGIVAWSFVPLGLSMVLFGVVRATGAVMMPLLILFFTMLLVRYPLAVWLLEYWQADAIWWSFPISSALAAILAASYYLFGSWRASRSMQTSARTQPL